MTSAVGGSSYGILDRTLATVGALQTQLDTLQSQTTTGKVAQAYSGLAGVSSQVLDLTATTSRASAYGQVIATAQGKASVIQAVLGQIGSIVGTVATAALALTGSAPTSTVNTVAQQAQDAFKQVASLLNTQYQGQYVFAGADSANPPVPAAGTVTSSGLYTQIGAAVAALATVPTTPAIGAVIASTAAIASSTNPATSVFSAYLLGAGAAPATITISDTESISLGLTANKNTGAISDPAIAGTGSAIGDILRGLAVVANTSGTLAANPDFSALLKDASATLHSAAGTLTEEQGRVGLTQNRLKAASVSAASFQLVLTKQLTGLTDVDSAATISKLQEVSTQLQASYKVLSLARGLNLASYL